VKDSTRSSPRLDALLRRLRRALARQVWLHGSGTVLAGAALWLLISFAADYFLHLPTPIRLLHLIALVLVPVVLAARELVGPLRRIPGRAGLALLIERVHPGTHDLLVSAVELGPEPRDSTARPLVERVLARADAAAASLDPGPVLDRRGPRRRVLAGLALGLTATTVLAARPGLTSVFMERMLGSSTPWPRLTHLSVEIPGGGDGVRINEEGDRILARVARGSDLAVLVRAEGVAPQEVVLHFDSGHKSAIASSGGHLYRTLLRSVQEDFSFHVTGGDDDRGVPRVEVTVLEPPDVAAIAWRIEPPAYSGLPSRVAFAPDVEVLAGSRVVVHVLPDPPEAAGMARIFPHDRELLLEPEPFPGGEEGHEPGGGRAIELVADTSMRISFHLTDETGLPNPDPGLFALTVIEDRRPEVLLLAPGRADLEVVLGGALPLRVRAQDDYGLAALTWDARSASNPDDAIAAGPLDPRPLEDPGFQTAGARVVQAASTRIEVDSLGGANPPREGQSILLQVFADDNRQPESNQSASAAVRLRVTSGDDFLRHLQDQLAQASERAQRLAELASEKQRLTGDLANAAGNGTEEGIGDLTALVHATRRVHGDARALARDLAAVAEGLLYSRIDERGAPLLAALDRALSETFDRGFHAGPWRDLVADYRAGRLGQADLAGTLVEIVGLALDASEDHFETAASELVAAAEAPDLAAVQAALERAARAQQRGRETLDGLLLKLGEWDNFQSVLTLTRDILNRQRNLIQRTRQMGEKR